jgi:hypothetical protein
MPGPDQVVAWPTLFVAIDWVEAHCVVPDGFAVGEPFELSAWQSWFYANHYRVRPEAEWIPDRPLLAPAFHNRRSQIVMPQKAGKGPLTAAQICLEGVGPALFGGWARGGELWDCRAHGCGCGWVYEYESNEPMGLPWPTPLIQVTATSEEQTANVYDALRPMIEKGPLAELIPKTGEEFIRLPGGGRIDTVTSNARSRLGQRVTFVVQDETGIWIKQTGMIKVADTQRRGLAGMGGRAVETTNAWDPTEDCVARRTAESKALDIFRLHPLPSADLKYAVATDRKRIHESVYAGSPWVDLAAIEAEAAELLERDPAQAERFFGNRVVAGSGAAFPADRWDQQLAKPKLVVEDGSLIVIGVDGARYRDALGIVATDVATGHQWPITIVEAPDPLPDNYEHDFDAVDDAMRDAFERWEVWRCYVDPQYIEGLRDRWQGRWGEKVVLDWLTHRQRPMAYALRAYRDAMASGEVSHNGDDVLARHIRNATKKAVNVVDDDGRPMWILGKPHESRKIDGSMAGCLSWAARGDAVAAGAMKTPEYAVMGFGGRRRR